jgi:hypothetical protein
MSAGPGGLRVITAPVKFNCHPNNRLDAHKRMANSLRSSMHDRSSSAQKNMAIQCNDPSGLDSLQISNPAYDRLHQDTDRKRIIRSGLVARKCV